MIAGSCFTSGRASKIEACFSNVLFTTHPSIEAQQLHPDKMWTSRSMAVRDSRDWAKPGQPLRKLFRCDAHSLLNREGLLGEMTRCNVGFSSDEADLPASLADGGEKCDEAA
jgi:hypothetical protein